MQIRSFFEENSELKALDIEMALWPGLPGIHFVGRADPQLKESSQRIKSAIKAAGFRFPVAQQILVNLAPTHIKKTSRGLELAVALLYLWKTDQIPAISSSDFHWIYGELGLDGRVKAPDDLAKISIPENERLLTGESSDLERVFQVVSLKNLSSTEDLQLHRKVDSEKPRPRPSFEKDLLFTEAEARILKILGVGGLHALFAGPAGSGKSTLARALYHLLPEISEREALSHSEWRPLVEPHHTTPRMAMIGGASPPRPGEIARAHGGLLLMDEFLEFDRFVLEALREPFEKGEMRIGRLGGVEVYPAEAQILATTNLCPCGSFIPGAAQPSRCRFSLKRCSSYSERLSGPLLDRFHVLVFVKNQKQKRKFSLEQIRDEVLEVQAWQKEQRGFALTRKISGGELWKSLTPSLQSVGLSEQELSERRRLAWLKTARSIADLEKSDEIKAKHIDEASVWVLDSFQRLSRWQFELGSGV